jgi:asparagine synthase (glutamine-hydrolysing)
MSEFSSDPVKTFTIGYGDEDASYNELSEARLVAEAFGTEHREFVLEPDVVELLPEIVEATGEPFADSSAIPTYLISRETRKHVTVALSGIGGDEAFLGYPRYLGARLSEFYETLPGFIRRRVVAPLAECLPESTGSRNLGGRIRRFVRGGELDRTARYLSWVSFLTEERKAALYGKDFRELVAGHDSASSYRARLEKSRHLGYVAAASLLDCTTYLPDDLLFMGDAMSMAHSLELRVPFCDHKLMEFMTRLPSNLKVRGFRLKGLMKRMLKGTLPDAILNRRKQGFMVPIGPWFQRDLQIYLRETLLSNRAGARGIFNPGAVEKMVTEHFKGTAVHTNPLWAMLTFETWCRLYMDRPAVSPKVSVLSGAG